MRSWAFFRKLLLLRLEQRQQGLKNGLGVADQGCVSLVSKTNAGRVKIDLNAFRLTRLRQKLHVWGSWYQS